MAVYEQTYTRYTGAMTRRMLRLTILMRHSYARLLRSRFVALFLALSLCYPIGCLAWIYITHNPRFMEVIQLGAGQLAVINGRFFYYYCVVQGAMAYLLTAFIAPGLIAPDLNDGALPLYFCRPLSRAEYITGKSAVLGSLLSLITWVPGLVLYFIQASLAGVGWMADHWWIARSLVVGLFVWVVVISLVGLAVSAWMKWRIAAGVAILGVFFVGAGLGTAINSILRSTQGSLINLIQVVHSVWAGLFGYTAAVTLPAGEAWGVLGFTCVLCLGVLIRRLRVVEVVR